MIIIESKRKKPATILKQYPDAILADVTSGAKDDLVKLSPFYPHGGIPVPFSEGYTATCVVGTASVFYSITDSDDVAVHIKDNFLFVSQIPELTGYLKLMLDNFFKTARTLDIEVEKCRLKECGL